MRLVPFRNLPLDVHHRTRPIRVHGLPRGLDAGENLLRAGVVLAPLGFGGGDLRLEHGDGELILFALLLLLIVGGLLVRGLEDLVRVDVLRLVDLAQEPLELVQAT